MDLIDQHIPEFLGLLTGVEFEMDAEERKLWESNLLDFQHKVVENWSNNWFICFAAECYAPSGEM